MVGADIENVYEIKPEFQRPRQMGDDTKFRTLLWKGRC
jgi:hypothetical protein